MSDSARSILVDAWGRIPQTHGTTAGLGTFTRTRIERIITLVVGFACLALGAQALIIALTGDSGERPGWHEVLIPVTFVPLAAMIIACGLGRAVPLFAGTFALVYLLVLVVWPIATAGVPIGPQEPWVFYLLNIATVAAVLAFPVPLQITSAAVTPVLFGIVWLIQTGFAAEMRVTVVLDVSFALILGGVLVTLAWVFRAVASHVDEVRAAAVSSYAAAAAADAAEQERVAVAGLMHDSVLAALIAAERATTPREKSLAASMAQEALTRLANTDSTDEEGSDDPVPPESMAAELERFAADLGVSLVIARGGMASAAPVPGRVARALVLAAAQAIANSVQHADAEGLEVAMAGSDSAGLSITVRDRGPGFDLTAIPPDRLGMRGSIVARVAAVGGTSHIDPRPSGTTVTIAWEGRG